MDIAYIISLLPQFLLKLPFTLGIIAIGFVFGFLLAFIVTLGRINRIPILSNILDLYVSFIRCIPSILLLFIIYFGLPFALKSWFGINIYHLNRVYYGLFSLILFNGGQISEVLRAAFLAMDQNQILLADSLNYTYSQKLFRIMVPQAFPIAMPDLENALINVMKDSALLFTIGIVDMMGQADIFIGNNYGVHQAEIYIAVGIVYMLCSMLLSGTIRIIERRFRIYYLMNEQEKGMDVRNENNNRNLS